MPVEINDKEKFIELSEKATECRVKKNKDNTKLKIRTEKYLYTIKLDPAEADEVVGQLGCPTVEIE
jgi:large subunit ribosomal protein L38e